MKFNVKKKQKQHGFSVEVIRKFLLLPKRIGQEIRWLELASYEVSYDKDKNSLKAVRWVEDKKGRRAKLLEEVPLDELKQYLPTATAVLAILLLAIFS